MWLRLIYGEDIFHVIFYNVFHCSQGFEQIHIKWKTQCHKPTIWAWLIYNPFNSQSVVILEMVSFWICHIPIIPCPHLPIIFHWFYPKLGSLRDHLRPLTSTRPRKGNLSISVRFLGPRPLSNPKLSFKKRSTRWARQTLAKLTNII